MSIIVTNEDFVATVKDLVGDEYTVIEPYVKSKIPIAILHNHCNRVWKISPSNFKKGNRCKYCSQEKKNKDKAFTIDEILDKFNKDVGSEYTLVDRDYKNMKTKMKIRHEVCGNEWYSDMCDMLGERGTRCPKCAAKRIGKMKRKTNEDFIEEIYNLVGDEYVLLEEYKTAVTKVDLLHAECGKIYNVEPNRCPHCNLKRKSSKGEMKIEDFLISKDINYIREYRIDECRYKLPLPFDFAIMDKDNNLKYLIEFDGRQHYELIEMWGGKSSLDEIKTKDNIKNKYCLDNKINLIRIPHWDYDNIEAILDELF